MWDTISQIAIFVLGVSSIVLVARKNKWGFVLGFLAQPFWFITSFINEQWGVFFVAFVYSGSWLYGIYEWFYKSRKEKVI
ncbi:MAG TPA: nicotinamide mononucleotide transporter [Candidatus Nanoarchaeia archaeon]|nr:nicotinamide mononucleotide transporter [Candidatus Nanoarchaeia archaeon]